MLIQNHDLPHLLLSPAVLPPVPLHIIVAVFQSQPLKMEFLAMKKVLELDLEVKPSDLPRELQVKAEKEESLA